MRLASRSYVKPVLIPFVVLQKINGHRRSICMSIYRLINSLIPILSLSYTAY
ncbi:Uncharacterised protein [Vibrio cholerae]|nr:Uncharacterised protein [Vibrio cholerae]CSI38792.1 Uncharacterised protein [Vibrio cholerae]CSI41895.1 Uncharacterised protein [Vibrio cholerae]